MTLVAENAQCVLPITEIVRAATLAPSPDNNQPWRFENRQDGLRICLDRERSLASDVNSMFDLTAIGAAIENACLAALHHGFTPHVEYLLQGRIDDSRERSVPVADISFTHGSTPDALYEMIAGRCTCRRPYETTPLDSASLARLASAADRFSDVKIDWITGAAQLKRLGRLVAAADSIRFQHRSFHEELYRQLRFTPQEAERTRDGLDVRTFELPFGAATVLKLLGSWRRMKWWQRLGLGPLLSGPSASLVRRSSAVAAFSTADDTPSSFLEAGRAIQRFWLNATSMNLSVHPLGSLPIFFAYLGESPESSLLPRHVRRITSTRRLFAQMLPASNARTPALFLRVGYSVGPTARSLRIVSSSTASDVWM